MASRAPITGAPTRAPISEQPDRPMSAILSDVQIALYQVETLLFASELASNEIGGIEDKYQRRLIGQMDQLASIALKLVLQAQDATNALETALKVEGH